MLKRDRSIVAGPDGDHEHGPDMRVRSVQPTNLKANLKLLNANQVWNNSAFSSNNDLITTEEKSTTTPLAARSSYCSAPIVSSSLAPVYAKAKAHMPLYIPYRHSSYCLSWNYIS